MNGMKKVFRWLGVALATPILLFGVLTVLLYMPPVQQFVLQKAADKASDLMGMQARIGRVRITPFFDFSLENFIATQGKDTVLDVQCLVADVPFRPLMDGEVQLNGLELKGAKVNTLQLIESVKIQGVLEYLALDSRGIFLREQQVKVQHLQLKSADLQVLLRDSVPEGTTSTPTHWKIDLQKVQLADTQLRLLMDSMRIQLGVGKGELKKLRLNLEDNSYQVAEAQLSHSAFALDLNALQPAEGLDFQHLALDSVELDARSIFNQGPVVKAEIKSGQLKERSGLKVNSLSGLWEMDAATMHAKSLELTTPYSIIALNADVDFNALDELKNEGQMNVLLDAELGREDLLLAMGPALAKEVKPLYPDRKLLAKMKMTGNLQRLGLSDTYLHLRDAVKADLSGTIDFPTDDIQRKGEIRLDATTQNLDFLLPMLNLKGAVIPHGMMAKGDVQFQGTQYGFDGLIRQGRGLLQMQGTYNALSERYEADLHLDSLNVHDFLPQDSIFFFSGDVMAQGQGFDLYAARTTADVQAQIRQLQYGAHNFLGVGADLQLAEHQLRGTISSDNRYLELQGNIDGYLMKDSVGALLDVEVKKLDLKQLEVARDSMVWAFHFSAEAQTNAVDSLMAKASLTDVRVATPKRTFTPKNLHTRALLQPDTVFLHAEAGDFYLDVQTQEGVDSLMARLDTLQTLFKRQYEQKQFSITEVQSAWPHSCVKLRSGSDNPFSNFFMYKGYAFKKLNLHFDVSPEEGLDGDLDIYSLRADSILLDTIRLEVAQLDSVLRFNGKIRNNRRNPQFVFNSQLVGRLMSDGAMARMYLYDAKNRLAVDLATRARFVEEGLRFTFHPDQPMLAYQHYNLNKDGFVLWRDNGQIEGDMSILTDEGMGLIFKAHPQEGQQQNMHLQLCQLNLEQFTNVLPYVPRISGIMNGELTASQPFEGQLTANGLLKFLNLEYEGSPMGENIEVALAYEPKGGNVHELLGTLRRNGEFVTTVGGDYNGNTGTLDLETILYRFPAEMVNGFIPDHIAGMSGIMEGNFHIEGSTNAPIINGTLTTDSVFLYSEPYAMNLRVENKSMNIRNSRLSLQNTGLFSDKNDKMTLNGTVDFCNLEEILLNLSMRANNFNIIDKPRNSQTLLYGKVFVDANATLSGPLDELRLRGSINLLGNTDVTYVLKDSPLTVEDRLSELVTFVDFNDTVQVDREVAHRELSGIDANLNLQIDEGAKISCDLSNNRESYVDLIGGGALLLRFTPEGKMLLTGRYTINSGEMKYEMPVIPLKTFQLGSGSYVEFTGDMMNPKLNIAATERNRTSVTNGEGAASRSVEFEVGVLITNTLNDMGLEFTIEAPEDLTVQNELASMSKEMKGRLAVTMLATGMYMAENNGSGGLNMSSALNSFLQSEISSIAGNALQSIDVSFGMEDGTTRDGRTSTDYSFRFAKRLWGNRVSIVIGGKVSSNAQYDNGSFIDDISLEYRLDNSGTRYVRLFHEKNFDTFLDGEIQETGAGIVLRKKMTRFGELFIFRNSRQREQINQNRERRRERLEQERQGDAENETENHHHHHESLLLEQAEKQRKELDEKQEKKNE